MLITQLKDKETIVSLTEGKKVFIINCHGCKEVHFPEKEAKELQDEMTADGKVTGILTTDYICNPDNLKLRFEKHAEDRSCRCSPCIFLRRRRTDGCRISGGQAGIRGLRYLSAAGLPGSNAAGIRLRSVR